MAKTRYYTDKQVSLRLSARNRGYIVHGKDSDKRMTICYDYKTNRSQQLEETMKRHGFNVRSNKVMVIYDYMIPGER